MEDKSDGVQRVQARQHVPWSDRKDDRRVESGVATAGAGDGRSSQRAGDRARRHRLRHLGCYGSPIATPNLDSLAEGGLLYNNMHTTALLAVPLVHRHRAQPSFERDGGDH
jgi:hypothetical protein